MDKKILDEYQIEDFIADETFINYYFKSNLSDRLFWEEWLLQHPEKLATANEAIDLIEALSLSLSEEEYRKEFLKIKKAIEKPQTVSEQINLKKLPQLKARRKRIIKYSMFFLLLVFSGLLWFLKHSQNEPEKLTATINNSKFPKQVILSDSTVVTLQPHSKIEYPQVFKSSIRNVYLQGNARFSVKRDVKHPFKVHSENMIATVLGTVFNVKTSGDSALVVELLKGKLNVAIVNSKMETEQSVILAPNERAVYVRNDKHLYKNLIVSLHNLHFKGSSFEEIAEKMKSNFGITLINKSPKKDWSFTGDFKDSTATNIIENICLVKNLSYSKKGDTIVIK
jgi:ferric-dicitrate binding protein FerR (iron transport regulator)